MTFLTLFKGELKRLVRYKILHVGLIVSLMWVALVALLSKQDASAILPVLIFTDTGIMSVMLLAAMMYFEKQEGTLRTTFITPVVKWHIIAVKISASVLLGLISAILISLTAFIIHGISANVLLLLLYVIIIVSANSTIGFIFIFISKDFNALLVNYMIFFLVLILPTIFDMLGLIPKNLIDIMLISPVFACNLLIVSAFEAGIEFYRILISALYLALPSALLLVFYVSKKLKNFSEGG